MRKIFFTASLLLVFTTIAYASIADKNTEALAVQNDNIGASTQYNSSDYQNRLFFLQKAVSAYTKAIKYSKRPCELTSNGVAACFAKVMKTSTRNGNIIVEKNYLWIFDITGNCSKSDNCTITIKRKAESFPIQLWLDEDGYLTTDNPKYQ